ncbi:MAG: hypothetical protein HY951_05315 [Bacteroidia bacterium]|nr:hypothetical protein [Bacteroidia bacterium]
MQKWLKIIIVLISTLCYNYVVAQNITVNSDSSNIYNKIETYSKRHNFTKFLYKIVFRPVVSSSQIPEVFIKEFVIVKQHSFVNFEGKIIRHIYIQTLDPFGYSISKPLVESKNIIFNAGNKLHIKSRHLTISNLLLIRKNQIFDSLLLKESERLIRSSGFVRDVSVFVIATSKLSDSIDIYIRELDKWSIIPNIDLSSSKLKINIVEKNFLGLGHEFKNAFTWYHTTGKNSYNTSYYIPNINNTFINSTLHYNSDEFRNYSKSFALDRPFFSSFTKWAAGFNLAQQYSEYIINSGDSLLFWQKLKLNIQDYWAGNAMQIFKGKSETNRTTNFITAIRFLRTRYIEKPIGLYDSLRVFSNEDFYLTSVGISMRKYVQDKYIFKFGVTEDIPIGKVFSLTGGYQKKNTNRFYVGSRFSLGNYFNWGYLSCNIEYGTFFRASNAEQGIINANVNYFTRILEIGNWKIRQFVKSQVTIGVNRLPNENITINDGYGIDGFNSPELIGTKRILFTLQTQSYAPWNFIGFCFGPYLNYSIGMLGNETKGFINNKIYTQIGIGVLIKNENLVLNTFHVSVSFYPIIPGNGIDIFKTNSFKTNDFGLRDFEIGKPDAIRYQ